MMAEVFDDVLYDRKTFGDLPEVGPKILINATALGTMSEHETGQSPPSAAFTRAFFFRAHIPVDTSGPNVRNALAHQSAEREVEGAQNP
jgi:hypothetical protein